MTENFEKFQHLVTPDGMASFARIVAAFRERYGRKWMAEFKMQNPDFVIIVDLCANYSAEEAVSELPKRMSEEYGFGAMVMTELFCQTYRKELFALHQGVRSEIDRKR